MHFFHSIWKNLHLTENFYTDMSVVSVTNMTYDYMQNIFTVTSTISLNDLIMFLLNMIRNSNIYGMKISSVSKCLSLYTEDHWQYIHSVRCLLWCAKTARLRSTLFLSSPLRRKKRTWESAVILRTWKYSCYLSIQKRGAVQ